MNSLWNRMSLSLAFWKFPWALHEKWGTCFLCSIAQTTSSWFDHLHSRRLSQNSFSFCQFLLLLSDYVLCKPLCFIWIWSLRKTALLTKVHEIVKCFSHFIFFLASKGAREPVGPIVVFQHPFTIVWWSNPWLLRWCASNFFG